MSAAQEFIPPEKQLTDIPIGLPPETFYATGAEFDNVVPLASKRLLGSLALETAPNPLLAEIASQSIDLTTDQSFTFVEIVHNAVVERVRNINAQHGRPRDTYLVKPQMVSDNIALIHSAYNLNDQTRPAYLEASYRQFVTDHVAVARWMRAKHPEVGYVTQLHSELTDYATEESSKLSLALLAAYGLTASMQRGHTKIDLARIARDAAGK